MSDEIIEVIEKTEHISNILMKLKDLSFDKLKKTAHFYVSVEEKNTDIKLLKEVFSQFERVKLINKRRHKNGKTSYDLYYELEDGTYIILGIALEKTPVLLNGYNVNRNFSRFRKFLLKAYKDKIIG
jgi:hypothetical protein